MFLPGDAVRVAALPEYLDSWVGDQHLWLPLHVARNAAARVRPGERCCSSAVQVAAAQPSGWR